MNTSAPGNRILREEFIFNAALELCDPEKRAAYLALACGDDYARRVTIEKMLAADHDSFFDKSAAQPGPVEARTLAAGLTAEPAIFAERIDRYQLLQRIGEGGCGVVYLAEQQ